MNGTGKFIFIINALAVLFALFMAVLIIGEGRVPWTFPTCFLNAYLCYWAWTNPRFMKDNK